MAGRLLEKPHTVLDGTALGVACPVNETSNPGMGDGARAHGARLQRDEEFQSCKAIIAPDLGRRSEREDFRMPGRITQTNGSIMRTRDDLVARWIDDHSTDRRLADISGCLR